MWAILAAADLPPAPAADNTGPWLVFAGVVIATLGSVIVAAITTKRREHTSAAPPSPHGADVGTLRERVAVNESRLTALETAVEDVEEVQDVIDRRGTKTEFRVDHIERFLDRQNPDGWR